ncbi:hypothetical protein KKF34_12730 [Myxococcota bacterium]|nr:hypothetical protein [Myxococcota bacterium]MBU1380608.1 hypothetical protein [Myxococcota bacterium]MBU1497731.1 hypothetical protein [Myxococcota bacterium]
MNRKRLLIGLLVFLNFSIFFKAACCRGGNKLVPSKTTGNWNEIKTFNDLTPGTIKKLETFLTKVFGNSFFVMTNPPLTLVSEYSAEHTNRIMNSTLMPFIDTMNRVYFDKKPDKPLVVLLFRGQKAYRSWGNKLFGEKTPPYFGYFMSDGRTLVMDYETGSGTLLHELTHALINYDFPSVPTWFNEGFASLFEACQFYEHDIKGVLNWRLPILKEALKNNSLRKLEDIFKDPEFYGDKHQNLNYAQSRYLALFLQRNNLLVKFYKEFRLKSMGGKKADPVKILEDVTGEKFTDFENSFVNWLGSLRQ